MLPRFWKNCTLSSFRAEEKPWNDSNKFLWNIADSMVSHPKKKSLIYSYHHENLKLMWTFWSDRTYQVGVKHNFLFSTSQCLNGSTKMTRNLHWTQNNILPWYANSVRDLVANPLASHNLCYLWANMWGQFYFGSEMSKLTNSLTHSLHGAESFLKS
jgi:hypothetical protein